MQISPQSSGRSSNPIGQNATIACGMPDRLQPHLDHAELRRATAAARAAPPARPARRGSGAGRSRCPPDRRTVRSAGARRECRRRRSGDHGGVSASIRSVEAAAGRSASGLRSPRATTSAACSTATSVSRRASPPSKRSSMSGARPARSSGDMSSTQMLKVSSPPRHGAVAEPVCSKPARRHSAFDGALSTPG